MPITLDATEVAKQLPMALRQQRLFLVAMRLGVTPVHIPNTMVKTQTADDTILETVWESRWLPDHKKILVLPVIREFKRLSFLMTDKHQSKS